MGQKGITEVTEWGLSEVASSTCIYTRKYLKGTTIEKFSKPFFGHQSAQVPQCLYDKDLALQCIVGNVVYFSFFCNIMLSIFCQLVSQVFFYGFLLSLLFVCIFLCIFVCLLFLVYLSNVQQTCSSTSINSFEDLIMRN